jgi:hypothetical protein
MCNKLVILSIKEVQEILQHWKANTTTRDMHVLRVEGFVSTSTLLLSLSFLLLLASSTTDVADAFAPQRLPTSSRSKSTGATAFRRQQQQQHQSVLLFAAAGDAGKNASDISHERVEDYKAHLSISRTNGESNAKVRTFVCSTTMKMIPTM